MTLRPLDWTFQMMSPLSVRHPMTVPADEQLLELEAEGERRRRTYPGWIAKGRMTQAEADRHLSILAALVNDLRPIDIDLPIEAFRRCCRAREDRRRAFGWSWDDRVRELRRELALRRNVYPALIAKGRLTEGEASTRCERMDAVHWTFWYFGHGLDWDAAIGADDLRRRLRRHAARSSVWELAAHAAGDPAAAHLDNPRFLAGAREDVAHATAAGLLDAPTEEAA